VRKRESDLWALELFDFWANDAVCTKSSHLNDLNASETSTMTSSHVSVKLIDSTNARDVSEFLVDVVGSGSAVIAAQNAKIFDLCWSLVKNLMD